METLAITIKKFTDFNYHDYLRSDEWKVKREEAIKRADRRCQICFSPNDLNVHHRTYDRVGNERNSDLIVLCKECHAKFHDKVVK